MDLQVEEYLITEIELWRENEKRRCNNDIIYDIEYWKDMETTKEEIKDDLLLWAEKTDYDYDDITDDDVEILSTYIFDWILEYDYIFFEHYTDEIYIKLYTIIPNISINLINE
tara:strand:- start:1210 stop:1548 length:339 start_codon:yes stop_codon:yes gene_type:complete